MLILCFEVMWTFVMGQFVTMPPAPLGLDGMVQTWPRLHLYAFHPMALLSVVFSSKIFSGSTLPGPSLVCGPSVFPGQNPLGDPSPERSSTPATLKVYVVTISASHIPLEGDSAGKHPLVICFLHGTRLMISAGCEFPPVI